MRHSTRNLTTLVGVLTAGFLIRDLPHFDRFETGGH